MISGLAAPPWLTRLLQDPSVTDLCLNGTREVFVDRREGMESLHLTEHEKIGWNEAQLKQWVLHQISKAEKTWDARFPFVDLMIDEGFRMHVAFPPMCAAGILVSLRRISGSLTGRSEARWCSPLYEKLVDLVQQGRSLLVCGATGSGKTTLAMDLLSAVPPHERIIALEDTPELRPAHPHFLSLVSRPANADGFGEVTLRDLLRQTLRMRPDRIVLGECRGAEVLDLLQLLNTGHRGAMATLHAHSPRDGLRRLELLCHLHDGSPLASSVLRELIASGVHGIVHVEKRRIQSLVEVAGIEGGTVLLRPLVRSAA